MKKPLLIGLTGPAGSGKSTAAAIIAAVSYKRLSFAEALREQVHSDMVGKKWAPGSSFAPIFEAAAGISPWQKPTPEPMRKLLQYYGTEYWRAADPAHWLKCLGHKLPLNDAVVLDDVRFQNEADYVKALGGEIWRLCYRQDKAVPSHASEAGIANASVDWLLDNSNDLPFLERQISERMASYDDSEG